MTNSVVTTCPPCINKAKVKNERMLDYKSEELLRSEDIDPSSAPITPKKVEIVHLNRLYSGIGIRNINGGLEYFSKQTGAVTIGRPGLLSVRKRKGLRSRQCCIFGNIMEYLRSASSPNQYQTAIIKENDCIVLNDFQNIEFFFRTCKKYEKTYSFLSETLTGQTIEKTLVSLPNQIVFKVCDNKIRQIKDKTSCKNHIQSIIMNEKDKLPNDRIVSHELTPTSVEKLRDLRDRYYNEVKHLEMLLASFNALTDTGDVHIAFPPKNTTYYFIRAVTKEEYFEVFPCKWSGCKSDRYRFVKGNYFVDEDAAEKSCQAINKRLIELCG